jgi:hypothetical protein
VQKIVAVKQLMQHLLFGKENFFRFLLVFFLSFSFDVQLCFESNDKLAQNLIIIYTLTADHLSTIGRILSNVNSLPTITNKQALNSCEKQTFITKVC